MPGREIVALVAGLLVAGLAFRGCSERQLGRLEAERDAAREAAARWEQRAGKADTVFLVKRDTLRLTRRVTDSILVTRVDTLVHRDTVRLLLAAERQACDQTLTACEVRVAARDSIAEALRRQVRALEKARPSWLERTGERLLWGAIGAGACKLARC